MTKGRRNQMAEPKQEEKSTLDILFPGEEVEIIPGFKVKIRPLMMSDLPKAINAIESLLIKAEALKGDQEAYADKFKFGTHLIKEGLAELLELIPLCTDTPLDRIPAIAGVPILIEKFIEQNMNAAIRAKWSALIQQLIATVGPMYQGMIEKGLIPSEDQ